MVLINKIKNIFYFHCFFGTGLAFIKGIKAKNNAIENAQKETPRIAWKLKVLI